MLGVRISGETNVIKCLGRSHQNVKSGPAVVKLVRVRLHRPPGQFPVGEPSILLQTQTQKHIIEALKKGDFELLVCSLIYH